MRKAIFGLGLAAFAATSAMAADMPAPGPYYTKAPPAPVYNWTGLYVDGGFGYGMYEADTTSFVPTTGICLTCVTQTPGGKGWLGTVGVGYDYQFSMLGYNLVMGALGAWDFSNIRGQITDTPFGAFAESGTEKETSAWAAGGRLGVLVTPSILTYFNVGATAAHFSGSTLGLVGLGAGPAISTTQSFSHTGYFIGSGTEIMLSPGWFARAEYRYSDFGTASITNTAIAAPFLFDTIKFHPVEQQVRTELVYKFNWFK
jgi:outer membrane immunogenic protein